MTRTVLLGDVIKIQKESLNPQRFPDTLYDVYSIPGYDNGSPEKLRGDDIKSNKFIVKSNSILVSKLNPRIPRVWKVDYASADSVSSTEFVVLKLRKGHEYLFDFIYAVLSSRDFNTFLQSRTKGTSGSHQRIKPEDIYEYELTIDRIKALKAGELIRSIDEKIELNRQMNETLEQTGQALFRHYFINNTEADKWESVPISELCDKISSGGTPTTKREDYYGGRVQWYSTKELRDGFLLGSEKTITDQGLINSAAKLFPENTVMIAIYAAPTVGRLGILTSEASFNQATCGLIAKPEIGYEFVYLYLLLSRSELNNMANGAAQQNISVGKVRNFKVMRPDNAYLSGFRQHITPIFAQIRNNSEEIQTLTTFRDTLLPRLISGRVKI